MKKSTTIYIGATFIAAIVIFIWGFNFLKGKDFLKHQRVFYARYHNVAGLLDANPVTLHGMQIGQVHSITFTKNYSGDILVQIIINKYFPIPIDSKAKIINSSLLGDKSVEIELGKSKQMAKSGDTLIGLTEVTLKEQVNSALAPMKARAEQILSNADSLISSINDALGRNGKNTLKSSLTDLQEMFKHLNSTTATLDDMLKSNNKKISGIVTNIDTFSVSLKNSRGDIQDVIANLKKITNSLSQAKLKETIANSNKTIKQIDLTLQKVNSGKGTVGALMNNDSLYLELNNSLIQLKKLVKDIRKNPKRYLKISVF